MTGVALASAPPEKSVTRFEDDRSRPETPSPMTAPVPVSIARPLAGLLAAFLAGGCASAQSMPGGPGGGPGSAPWAVADDPDATDLVKIDLLADVARPVPGETFHVAVAMSIVPHWHTYWRNPGASGAAPQVDLDLPEGWTAGAMRFPRPRTFEGPEGTTIGYEHEVVYLIPVTPPEDARGSARIGASIFYLVCKESCLIGDVEHELVVDLAAPGTTAAPSRHERLARSRRAMPRPLAVAGTGADAAKPQRSATLRVEEDRIVADVPAEGRTQVGFLPAPAPGVVFAPPEITVEGGRARVVVPYRIDPGNVLGEPVVLRGLVTLGTKQDDPSWEIAHPVDTP